MKAGQKPKFKCVVVGGTSLPIRCAEMIQAAGHEVLAFVSADRDVISFAREKGVRVIDPRTDVALALSEPFDHLFSIVNENILRDDILALPRGLAVNYHDAPLPRYAGTHATSWALMNRETAHGVTWHLISDTVDAGDILEQETVAIDPGDTAYTLNLKCYEAALNSFGRLLRTLSEGEVVGQKQDLEKRTFFPRFKRPAAGGVVDWRQPADKISALVRSLNFENQPNPLGCAKIKIDDSFYIVRDVSLTNERATVPAGTIVHLDDRTLRVATANFDLQIRELFQLDGLPAPLAEIAASHTLVAGNVLPVLGDDEKRQIEDAYRATCKHEKGLVQRLASLTPCEAPYASASAKKGSQHREVQIPISDITKLTRIAREIGSTERDLLSAVFVLMLWRISGLDEFDIAFRIDDGESSPVVDSLLERRVPVRLSPDASADFASFLSDTRDRFSASERENFYIKDLHFRFPELRQRRDSDGFADLPVAINWGNAADADRCKHDLVLTVSEELSRCCLSYDGERICDENAVRLAQCVGVLLDTAVRDPRVSISRMTLLNSDELNKVVVEWNDNSAPFPNDKCINELFEEQVSRTPDAIGLVSGNRRLSYAELNTEANKLASYLKSRGIEKETLVGVCLDRSPELVITILAILKSGGAYVPLDPAYPAARLTQILSNSNASFIVTTEGHVDRLEAHRGSLIYLDRDRAEIDSQSDKNLTAITSSRNLAYVLYTSGSTGEPKGVAIEHRSVSALIGWARSVYSHEELNGVLFSTSICFDLSAFEMFVPLCSGGKVVLVENILHLPGTASAEEVVLINTVPSAGTELLRIKGIPPSVTTVNLAGEPLRSELVEQLYSLGTVRKVFDLYGPTEDTTYSTFTLREIGHPPTIGRPIANSQAFILDRFQQPVPVGIPGELYLAGEGLARGYLNRPDLTDERFVQNPFDSGMSRMYRTGDRTRFRNDGQIEFLGRIDNQVKIRGFRIELGEIESRLRTHPGVREAVAIAHEDRNGDRQLVAYVVRDPKADDAVAGLREYLKERLPHFMVPSVIVEIDSLPLTPNGKIDRKALPSPSTVQPTRTRNEDLDPIETELIAIWERILDVPSVGLTDNFFELGGHSLQAVRMFAEVEETFGKNIPLATLFEAGTVEQLADLLRQDGWESPESSLVPIQIEGSKPPFFCVHAKGGNVLFYKDLARHLGTDQPFYGIQARRLAGRQVGHESVEEMAAFYIREIKGCQPEGPYYVGGASFGGLAAFEIAQQLRKQGDEVAMVALLDTGTPDYPQLLPTTTKLRSKFFTAVRRFQHHRDSLMLLDNGGRLDYFTSRLKKVRLKYRRRVRDTYKKAVRRLYTHVGGPTALPKKYIQLEDQIAKAGLKYLPQPYPDKVTLFRATMQPMGIVPDPTLGWDRYVTGEFEIHDVPGHHGAIVTEPFVRVLAEKLEACLGRASESRKLTHSAEHSDRKIQQFETARA